MIHDGADIYNPSRRSHQVIQIGTIGDLCDVLKTDNRHDVRAQVSWCHDVGNATTRQAELRYMLRVDCIV